MSEKILVHTVLPPREAAMIVPTITVADISHLFVSRPSLTIPCSLSAPFRKNSYSHIRWGIGRGKKMCPSIPRPTTYISGETTSEQTIWATPAPTLPFTITMIETMKAARLKAHPISPRPGIGIRKSAHATARQIHPAFTGGFCGPEGSVLAPSVSMRFLLYTPADVKGKEHPIFEIGPVAYRVSFLSARLCRRRRKGGVVCRSAGGDLYIRLRS